MNAGVKPRPGQLVEVFLQPGEYHFGDRNTRIRTLLGSCVSVVIWHPLLLIGGMCHFLLPQRSGRHSGSTLDGRYADEALQLLLQAASAAGTRAEEYQAKLFGGGNMFPDYLRQPHLKRSPELLPDKLIAPAPGPLPHSLSCPQCSKLQCNVGCINSAAARKLLQQHGLTLIAEDIGGDGHRQVIFDIGSGYTWVRQTPVHTAIR